MIKVKEIEHGSPAYWHTVQLRDEILRKPLKMVFSDEQLQKEKDGWHLALYENDSLVACLILSPDGTKKVQMRQVAVQQLQQKKGYGKELLKAAEQFAMQKGFGLMFCHARKEAVPFYQKNGYLITKGPFLEIGIEHFEMEKALTAAI